MVTEITMEDMVAGGIYTTDRASVVMFYGATCGPCKATLPHYEEIAQHFTSRGASIDFFKIHAWENEEQKTYCRETWGIDGVPQFKVLYNGEAILDRRGGGDYNTMSAFIQDAVDIIFRTHGGMV